jgi:predicted RNA-binding protein associated with RNAse of E/G family
MPEEIFEVPAGAMNIIEVDLSEITRHSVDEEGVTTTPAYLLDLLIVPHGEVHPLGRASFVVDRDELAAIVAGIVEGMALS